MIRAWQPMYHVDPPSRPARWRQGGGKGPRMRCAAGRARLCSRRDCGSHRHQILRLVLWANIPPTSVLVLLHRQDRESLLLVSLVAGLAMLATFSRGTRSLRAALVSVGLMACAGLAAFASTGPQRFGYSVVMTASIALDRSWAVLAVACFFGIGEELVLGNG